MNCPKCNKQECIIEDNNDIKSYFCLDCGFSTKSTYHAKNFEFQPTIIHMDVDNKRMIWKDVSTGLYWFPISLDIPKVGVLFPQWEGEDIKWTYMPMMAVPDDQKKKYPGKKEIPDEYRKKIFNVSNLKEALKLLNVIQ